ncbi:MAG TPA: OmpA family protein [Opitutus sp.]|nr:OmpA family protein [Opitutus sp.]
MNKASQKFLFVVASAAVLLAGCAKKPVRPDPSATVIGPNTGGTINPTDMGQFADANSALAPRDADFDINGQKRGVLEPVYFDLNESNIKPGERAKLQAAKDYLDKDPSVRLLLEGHCDWRGTEEYNLGLGDRRANAAKKYLTSIGVAPDRLETLSKGSLDAKKDGGEAQWSKDRRDELVLLKK